MTDASQERDVNGRLIDSLFAYGSMRLGEGAATTSFEAALEKEGLTRASAIDPHGWVTLAAFHRVADAFRASLGDTFVTDAITWAVPRRREFSSMSLSALSTPTFLFKRLDRARSFFARHVHFSVELAKDGVADITLHYRDGVPRRAESCAIARGVLHAVPLLFDLPPSSVEETACYAKGADACVYKVHYRTELPLGAIGAGIGAVVAATGALVVAPSFAWLAAPALGWAVGRELWMSRVRKQMVRVSEEHRRVLGENEREFQRRFDEIAQLNEQLEERVASRTEDLTVTMTALRESNADLRRTVEKMRVIRSEVLDAGVREVLGRAVQEFAHELKNPMTIVLANLQFLESPLESVSDLNELDDIAKDIRAGVLRMRAVIAWFISLYESDIEPSLCAMDEHVVALLAPLERQWKDRIAITHALEPLQVLARGTQLVQVVENLLTNAVHAVESGGTISVHARKDGDFAMIEVTDNGPGISAEHLAHIFERGFTTKEGRGTGLGLYISRAIVERHSGTLAVRSEAGKGATFEMRIPLAPT